MNWDQFTKQLEIMQQKLSKEMKLDLMLKIESAALRFVDDNFRAQGWEGQAWKPSKGTILVKTGALRRGFQSQVTTGQVRITNSLPYAQPNNEGFEGTVTVPEHNRVIYVKNGRKKKKTGSAKVKGYKKKMTLPKRQFAPYEGHESPTLNNTVKTLIQTEIAKTLKP